MLECPTAPAAAGRAGAGGFGAGGRAVDGDAVGRCSPSAAVLAVGGLRFTKSLGR